MSTAKKPGVSRRKFLKYGGGVVVLGAAAAAGYYALSASRAPPPTNATSVLTSVPTSVVTTPAGKLMTTAWHEDALSLDPQGQNQTGYGLTANLYQTLVEFGTKTMPDGTLYYDFDHPQPQLAESIEVSSDGTTITLPLRKGVQFHGGQILSADDVVWSWEKIFWHGAQFGLDTQFNAGSIYAPPTKLDDMTVEFTLKKPNPLAVPDLCVKSASIMCKSWMQPHATTDDPYAYNWSKNNANGTGPFMLDTWKPNEQWIFNKNPNYWNIGGNGPTPSPNLDRVVVNIVPDPGTREMLLEGASIDACAWLDKKDYKSLVQQPGIIVNDQPVENECTWFSMNVRDDIDVYKGKNPWSDQNVRYAVSWAIPYDQIISDVCFGYSRRTYTPISPLTTGSVGDKYWTPLFGGAPNLDTAKAFMAKSDWPNGFESPCIIQLEIPLWHDVGTVIQAALLNIGIKLDIQYIPIGTIWSMQANKNLPSMVYYFRGWLNNAAYYLWWNFNSSSIYNISQFTSPELDTMIDTARFESDPSKYLDELDAIQKMIVTAAPQAWLYNDNFEAAYRNYISGYKYWYHQQFEYAWFNKTSTSTS